MSRLFIVMRSFLIIGSSTLLSGLLPFSAFAQTEPPHHAATPGNKAANKQFSAAENRATDNRQMRKNGRAAKADAETIEVISPWAKEMMPAAKVGAGYFEIKNTGKRALRLYAVESDIAEKIEIHSMTMKDNVMEMRHLGDGIEIPPHSTLLFRPGSYHLMFINPKTAFTAGATFITHFKFTDNTEKTVRFSVRASGRNVAASGMETSLPRGDTPGDSVRYKAQ